MISPSFGWDNSGGTRRKSRRDLGCFIMGFMSCAFVIACVSLCFYFALYLLRFAL